MFVLLELLVTEHLDAAFTALQLLTGLYVVLLSVTWCVALLHKDPQRRAWARELLEDLLQLPRALMRFLSGRGER